MNRRTFLRKTGSVTAFAAAGERLSPKARVRSAEALRSGSSGGGSGHGYKHGIVLGDYVANRIVGKDAQPELAGTFKLKDKTF